MSLSLSFRRSRPEPEGVQWDRMREAARLRALATALRAREMTGSGIASARMWSAPQIQRAAGYLEGSLAPRLSSMMNATAMRLDPTPPPRRHRVRTAMLVSLAALGAAGVVSALVVRYKLSNGTYIEEYVEVDEVGSPVKEKATQAAESAKDRAEETF